jgi:hypothetical protein
MAAQKPYDNLPAINQSISPVASENQPLLFKRFVAAFNQTYDPLFAKTIKSNLADSDSIYYLRQQLQALLDIWRATGDNGYLEKARQLSLKAITDASASPKPLLIYKQTRGVWPCFFAKDLETITGGHGQLYDFQGAAGLTMVAMALREKQHPDANLIADFVEQKIITKWLQVDPNVDHRRFWDNDSKRLILNFLDTGRDKREHFACICMDLERLGCTAYPYKNWAQFLVNIYIGRRESLAQKSPEYKSLGNLEPNDWGVIANKRTDGLVWYFINQNPVIEDTSHANRTVWLAARAYTNGFIDRNELNKFINTLKKQIWQPQKGIFYFSNQIDGTDPGKYPGSIGNLWFGWHRLAAYDPELKRLFISLAYDLTNGGPNIPGQAQNKGMKEAPSCLIAWAARLISPGGEPLKFP